MILLSLAALALWSVLATIHAMTTDDYRRMPTR